MLLHQVGNFKVEEVEMWMFNTPIDSVVHNHRYSTHINKCHKTLNFFSYVDEPKSR
jgi:hypothetical protein